MAEAREDIEVISTTGTQIEFGRGIVYSGVKRIDITTATAANDKFPLFQLPAEGYLVSMKIYNGAITGGTNFAVGLYSIDNIDTEIKKDAIATGLDLSTATAKGESLDVMSYMTPANWLMPTNKIPAVATALGAKLASTDRFWLCLTSVAKPSAAGIIYVEYKWIVRSS